ncbi:MAG: hypothetical protein GXY38_09510 [Planctomycetes bacterium]|jgi:hypothetical protein|nr:hypothetical protein [Planctomycetota bacterium]
MQNTIKAATCAIVLLAAAAVSQAAIIVYATHSDYKPEPGASLTDVQLTVDMSVKDGVATFSFLNSSKRPETSVSFKEIVLDGHAQLTDTKVLWAPAVPPDTRDIGYATARECPHTRSRTM